MSSQFEDLFKARNEEKAPPKKKPGSSKKTVPTPPPVVKKTDKKTEENVLAKSKNLDFEQALIYLKKDTKKEVKKSLLDDPSGKDFSELVEELLSDWLKKKK